MKANIFKWLCAFAIVLSIAEPRSTIAQTNYSVPVTLSISNTAIDRVIGALMKNYSSMDLTNGTSTQSIELQSIDVVTTYALGQNYPNPFNPTTVINYQIPNDGHVTLKVYDILGREVKALVNENKQVGSYSVTLDGSGLASGVYFYKLTSGSYVSTKKAILMK